MATPSTAVAAPVAFWQKPVEVLEWLKCSEDPAYFVDTYCFIHDASAGDWVRFRLWKEQIEVLDAFQREKLIIVLKARQLGVSWLCVAYVLWLMVFYHDKTALLFSRRDDEAVHLLDFRLRGMYRRLPDWIKLRGVDTNSAHIFHLSNGSVATAFPTSAGDSYSASLAVIDEADLVENLDQMLTAIKPTIDAPGGKLIMVSRSDKSRPASAFKRIFASAWKKNGSSPWFAIFLPWWVRPGRDKAWYEDIKKDILTRTGAEDDLHEQYPATPEEAISARTLDKRIPSEWLNKVYIEATPMALIELIKPPMMLLSSFTGLEVYQKPQEKRLYAIGVDPAEGNPTSDDSSLTILDVETLEEVASLAMPIEPTVFAERVAELAVLYNNAGVLVERNNHGHAVIGWLVNGVKQSVEVLRGADGKYGRVKIGRAHV